MYIINPSHIIEFIEILQRENTKISFGLSINCLFTKIENEKSTWNGILRSLGIIHQLIHIFGPPFCKKFGSLKIRDLSKLRLHNENENALSKKISI